MKILITLLMMAACVARAQDAGYPKAKVSFEDFARLVQEVEPHRASRLVDLPTFLAMSREPDTIILDARSTFRFERIHLQAPGTSPSPTSRRRISPRSSPPSTRASSSTATTTLMATRPTSPPRSPAPAPSPFPKPEASSPRRKSRS